ncbi:hypothetical protein J3F84DRAFT_393562 [Trichoderma pleuroticola]
MPLPAIDSLVSEILELTMGHFCLHYGAKCRNPTATHYYISGTEQGNDSPSWYSLDRHALFSFCLVSWHFSGIAQTILYHEFASGYGDSGESTTYAWDRRLTSFMQTVAKRPELGRVVKRVYIHPFLIKDIDVGDVMHALGEKVELPQKQRQWLAAELVSTVIAQLPKLDHLSLRVLPYGPGRFRGIDMGFDLEIRLRGLLRSGTFSRVPILSLPRLANIRMTESRIREGSLESQILMSSYVHIIKASRTATLHQFSRLTFHAYPQYK